MADIQSIVSEGAFWLSYHRVADVPIPDGLRPLFDSNEKGDPILSLRLPCIDSYAMQLDLNAAYWSLELSLRDMDAGRSYEMGWWDDARWHPNALRWAELAALREHWRANKSRLPVTPGVAFLLLVSFVGNGVGEQTEFGQRRNTLEAEFELLGLFTESDVKELAQRALSAPPEDDYEWKRDEELGWTFDGAYPCYSLRNRAHADGSEGRFPFREWEYVLSRLPSSPDTT